MRSALRSLLVFVLVAVGGGALLAAPALAGRAAGAGDSSSSPLAGALVPPSVDQLLLGEGARAANQARRSNPMGIAQRRASRSKFRGLDAAGVASEAKSAFPALIEQTAGGSPTLSHGEQIVDYPTDHTAVVSLPSGAKGVIETFAPIARKSGHRRLPLDLHLADGGGHFAPVRSSVDIEIPKDIAHGIALADLGVSLTPVDRHGSPLAGSVGSLEGAAVLWRHSDAAADARDLASVAKAAPEGFDLTTMLLSDSSPGRLYFRVGTPAGAHLRETSSGAVLILQGDSPLATIAPVSAEDAEGTSVPVLTSIHGHTLELSLDLSGDHLFPIAVDPEINDSQLAETTAHKRSNWEFFTTNAGRFGKAMVYEGPGAERLETKGLASYAGGEWAYWGYQTKGVSHIYEIKTETSAHNKEAKIESFLEFVEPGGARETKKMLSNEFENPEYEKKAVTACAANASKVEECLPASGKANNAVHFQQSATGSPVNPFFSDTMSQGIVSIAEPTGTHSTTSFNTTSPNLELEVEKEGKKEKISRTNVLYGTGSWLSKFGGAFQMQAADTGIGVSLTKLEYESSAGKWTQLLEHDYLNVENACQGVQCYVNHSENTTLPAGLPDGEQKIRYKAEEAMPGTQSLTTEGKTTVKIDTAKPHDLQINGLPYGGELTERPYQLTVQASDGEGSTLASSGIEVIKLSVDGKELAGAGGSCSVAKGECTATNKWTVNGAELGSGHHDIVVVAFDKAGNEARIFEPVSIRHSTPVNLGPGSVDLQSGDFALSGKDVSLGSGLTVGRNYSSRATWAGETGPLGPQWSLSLTTTESLKELVNGSVLMTAGDGRQAIFADAGGGKFESPVGDSNLELSLEENKSTKQKLAYYLKNVAAHTSVKFTRPVGAAYWVPTKQEGTAATDTVTYSYQLGKFVEYPVTGSGEIRPQQIIAGPEGNMWFTEGNETNKIGKITPQGAITEYPTGKLNGVKAIGAGQDGNIWFSSNAGGEIMTMSPTGTVTTKLGGGCSCSWGSIAPGPNQKMWFTKYNPAHLFWMSLSGSESQEYTLPVGSGPDDITEGPDGNMWFTENPVSKIGKITPTGTITQYELPAGWHPGALTEGADGNMWYVVGKEFTQKIGKITTAGAITEYPLPAGVEARAITTGADGNLWLADSSGDKVIKVTPKGEVVGEYGLPGPPPYGATPEGITAGPEGNVWFTGALSKNIGVVPTSGPPVEPTEELAPVPAGVSCSPELKAGCRALKFKYATSTTATGGGKSEWGDFQTRLTEVSIKAYDPSSKAMKETAVAKYAYDKSGRLRAQWDPRISPNLKKTYGYDGEGHVTALAEPGQEPWTFSYGTVSSDTGTGRLLKAARPAASTELWSGTPLANTVAPQIKGGATEGVTLSVSTGTWTGGPTSYAYRWKDCNTAGLMCKDILGANSANYKLQASDVGHKVMAVVQAVNGGGSVAASSSTGTVASVSSQFTEFAVPAGSGPRGMAAGPMFYAGWFTNFTSNKVGKITPAGVITEYALPAASGPEGVAKGLDGSMWVTEFTSSKIAKVRETGTTEYALPAGSGPKDITSGADTNLWFTDYTTNKIGKITTAGAVTEYALPAASGPYAIASGSDTNLWFTEFQSHKIGVITKAGVITEYALPGGGTPTGITSGPDGNLWYVVKSTQKLGKITTSGTITEYSLPAGTNPEYITSAAGSLWISSKAKAKLYQATTAGKVTEYTLPAGSQPQGMSLNPLGELWYSEANDKVGKFVASNLTDGEARAPEPGITLNYSVPVSGTGAPYNMNKAETAKWGQSDYPVEATAITAADEPQGWPASSYKRASVYYLDEQGRQVNVAAPSTATYGTISTSEYNEFNDVIRTLSADNRATALAAGVSSVEKSKLLDTQSTYNGEGAKEGEVLEPGSLLLDVLGPQHLIKYRAGGEQNESLARHHEKFVYDQGAPSGGETYHLLTEKYDLAQLANHEEVEVRTSKTSYSGQSNLGWKLRAPTSVTVDPEGSNLTTTTEYNSTTAQITEVRGAGADKTLSYESKFGEAGTEAGKLKNPWGVAVNSEGKLWVVDSANNRVEQFTSAGSYVTKFGETGSGNGQFKEPQGIALDAAGHIWVADTGNNRLQEFSSTGTFMATVGSLGSESGKFKAPAALAFDAKGNMWVADTGNSRVEKFDKEAKYVSEFGSAGAEPGKLKEPKGIAVDSGEHVWVADTANNRIQEFSIAGSLLKRFGTPGAGEGQLNTPIDLKIDSSGNIWTVDSLNSRAESFTPNGAYVTQIGWKGAEAGQLTEPRGLAFDATGKAWVTDSSNNRLERWSKGPNAHDSRTIYYSAAANGEYPACGSHPEWANLVCETLPAKQAELMGLPKLPVTVTSYNMWNEPETVTETFGATTRTKTMTYDEAGRRKSVETTASTGVSLPKVNFTYNSELGALEKQSTEGEGKVLASEFNRLGQTVKYTDADGNVAKFKYGGPENDFLLEEASDSSASGTSRQTYEYDPTTKLRTKLIDSAAGSFTATYDAEAKMTSVSYPFSMCANYSYNSVGEATDVSYTKSSTCSESEPGIWYSNSRIPSIRGELGGQTSTLASESYAYDATGRLIEAQETPTGEGCTVRAYSFDPEGNRATSASRGPGVGGACQAEGGTIEGHNYDEANRLADGGMAYDGLGNVTKLPAVDAEGKELTSTFYVDNAVATQTQGGVTNEYQLDPEGRTRETTTGASKTKSHYDGTGEAVAWTENAEQWTRNIAGIDGTLLATQTNGATPILQLHDLQGNVVGTIGNKAGETKLLSNYNSTEFGVPNAGKTPPKFAWLGAAGIESSFTTGVVTYGATSYVPQTARPLQSEAVEPPGLPGGSGAGAPYTMQEEPWNMQGAARAGAEAPGLEAAREQAALEAALAAAVAHDPVVMLSMADARIKGEGFLKIATVAELASVLGSIPTDLVDLVIGQVVDHFSIDIGLDWFHKAGAKLIKCSYMYKQGFGKCLFRYSESSISVFGHTIVSWVYLGDEPEVEKCVHTLIPTDPVKGTYGKLCEPLYMPPFWWMR
jgi:streptogramin lyase